MNAKRKQAEEKILAGIGAFSSSFNTNLYRDTFKKMTDKEFDIFMHRLKNKETPISLIATTDGKLKLRVEDMMKIADKMGYSLFQKLVVGPKGKPGDSDHIHKHKTMVEYLILRLPYRRASQTQRKAISVSNDNKKIDILTGQVTGDDRSVKITKPEAEVLLGSGMTETLGELYKIRGGDLGSSRASNISLSRYGRVSQKQIEPYQTGVVSTKVLASIFNAMHIRIKI